MRLAEDYAPLDFTPAATARADRTKWVYMCMIEAFETLRRIPGRVGPKGPGSGWPAIVRELGDYHSGTFEDTPEPELKRRLTTKQIGRMEEVLQWPAKFLADAPQAADALNLWAYCKAYHRSIDGALGERAKAAADIARRIERETGAKFVLPANCFPDKVISRASLDRWRLVAATLIADGLSRSKNT